MQSGVKQARDSFIRCRSFESPSKENEFFFLVDAHPDQPFEKQVLQLEREYDSALSSRGLSPDTVVYRRFFLSDAANQIEVLKKSHLFADPEGRIHAAISVIQQPPVRSSKVAVLAYHVDSKKGMTKIPGGEHSLLVRRNGTSQLWFTNLQESETTEEFARSSYRQTDFLFQSLLDQLAAHKATLKDNTIRTWVYVRDVDRNYKGMVDRRRELFSDQGLTSQTHFISSTGIEGCTASPHALVTMDALSLLGVQSRQIRFLHAPQNLCNTIRYNVTFERGTMVSYRDRAHLYISGTASIDKDGHVVHEGDVLLQTRRTLENIRALLADGAAELKDMMYWIVYIRDFSDAHTVAAYLDSLPEKVPYLLLHAPVCRPQWLIEIEGQAVIPLKASDLPEF
jgi:enamine deaminase RidA (YjgF/YER057c/UK114 family)